MKRFFLCAAASVALLVAACGTKPKPLEISRTQVVQGAQLSLAAIEGGVAAYKAEHPIPPDVEAKLLEAQAVARQLIADLQNAPASEIPNRAQEFATAMNMLVRAIPPGVLPPAATAGLVAFGAMAHIIGQTAVQEPTVELSKGPVPSSPPVVVAPPSEPADKPKDEGVMSILPAAAEVPPPSAIKN